MTRRPAELEIAIVGAGALAAAAALKKLGHEPVILEGLFVCDFTEAIRGQLFDAKRQAPTLAAAVSRHLSGASAA